MDELILLGTGTCSVTAERSMPAHALRVGDETWLLDVGAGALRGMAKAGLSVHRVRGVLLSHLHTDHVSDLAPLLFSRRYDPRAGDVPNPLEMRGPEGTGEFLMHLNRAHAGHLYGELNPPVVVEYGPDEEPRTDRLGPLSVAAFRVEHGVRPAFGYRIDVGGFVLAYSGDTEPCEGLARLAADADLFLCECSAPDNAAVPGHMTPSGVGAVAAEAGCRTVVLTHLYPDMDGVDAERIIGRVFPGRVVRGEDGMRFSLSR